MALSNWDTLAIDLDGNPTNGVFKSQRSGATVELYKNWIYVRDPKAWREGDGRYVNDVVLEIQHGSLCYQNIHIAAMRGPQQGVFVVCWTVDYNEKPAKYEGMIGCGVYGFDNEDWVGVTKESLDFLKEWITKGEPAWDEEEIEKEAEWFKEAIERGTANCSLEEFKKKKREQMSYDFDDRIRKVDFSRALRFCQGDGFFENALGEERSGTPVGEADTPVLLKLLGK